MYNDFCINEINSELLINYLIQYKVVDKYNIDNNIFYDMIKFLIIYFLIFKQYLMVLIRVKNMIISKFIF